MTRLRSLIGSAVVTSLVCATASAQVHPSGARSRSDEWATRVARALSGSIEGIVQDEIGRPLGGAMVSALGATNALAVTDRFGRFSLRSLPPGAYLVRAHLVGYAASRRQMIQVQPTGPARFDVSLRRVGLRDGLGVPDTPRVLAAGLVSYPPDAGAEAPSAAAPGDATKNPPDDDHSETAWRIKHLKRSVLKETTGQDTVADAGSLPGSRGDWLVPDGLSVVARALGSSARAASALFGGLPLSGEINLLTTGTFDDRGGFSAPNLMSRGVAYFAVGGPASQHGDWAAQALVTQGDVGSWYLAGAYRRHSPSSHVYDFGIAYSAQRFVTVARGLATPGTEGTRSAVALYGADLWSPSSWMSLDYGMRYARYDYLEGFGLVSPRLRVTVKPFEGFRIQSSVSQRMLAPGAEEFMQPLAVGLWVPPDRTFADVSRDGNLEPERARYYEVALEHDLATSYVVSFRTFYQQVENQQLAVFGSDPLNAFGPSFGRYFVSEAGDFHARGWSVGFGNALSRNVRGSVNYEVATVDWTSGPDPALVGVWTPPIGKESRLHDLTTSVETEIPQTATRVFVLYRINSAFARPEHDVLRQALDGRFDLQVTQRLPFLDFSSAQWQVLLAIRNLFREAAADGSLYDEVLVVRPPTRVVGGVLVRF
jgi:Carboxypeptidase regulatory-like domain/TonB dependent receptor-like, beta-barrel